MQAATRLLRVPCAAISCGCEVCSSWCSTGQAAAASMQWQSLRSHTAGAANTGASASGADCGDAQRQPVQSSSCQVTVPT